jgi:hypothetical protein
VLSLGADEGACVRLGVLVADCARFDEHVAGCFVRRGGVVVEVCVDAGRLLEELGEMLYVRWGYMAVGQLLCY